LEVPFWSTTDQPQQGKLWERADMVTNKFNKLALRPLIIALVQAIDDNQEWFLDS
jgi:hypothetical protein